MLLLSALSNGLHGHQRTLLKWRGLHISGYVNILFKTFFFFSLITTSDCLPRTLVLYGQPFLVNRWVADGSQQRASRGWAWYLGRLGRRGLIAAPSPELPLNIKYNTQRLASHWRSIHPFCTTRQWFCIVLKLQSRAHMHAYRWFGSTQHRTDGLVPFFFLLVLQRVQTEVLCHFYFKR